MRSSKRVNGGDEKKAGISTAFACNEAGFFFYFWFKRSSSMMRSACDSVFKCSRLSEGAPERVFICLARILGFPVGREKKGSKGRRRAPLKRRQTPKLGKQKKERDREREREKNNSANDRRLSALKTRTLSSISEEKSWKKNKKEGEETDGMEVWNLSIRSSFDFVLSIPYPTIISS